MEEQKYTIEFTEGELHRLVDVIEFSDDWIHDEKLHSSANKIIDALNGFDGIESFHREAIAEAIDKADRGETVYLTSEEAETRMDALKEGLKDA